MSARVVVVTGSRDWIDALAIREALAAAKAGVVIHGACNTGADQFAGHWAHETGTPLLTAPALWGAHGNAAGPLRNEFQAFVGAALARELSPSVPPLLVAAPLGGPGTRSMMAIAEREGYELLRVRGAK